MYLKKLYVCLRVTNQCGTLVICVVMLRYVYMQLLCYVGNTPSSSGQGTGPLQMGFGGHIEVIHSREFKIAGAVGPCASMKKNNSASVAEVEVGIGYVLMRTQCSICVSVLHVFLAVVWHASASILCVCYCDFICG